MFGNWFYTKIRACERALEHGRIDDAARLALDAEPRDDKRVAVLREKVGRALLARARVRTQEGRYRDALTDLEALRALGYHDPDGEALRTRVLDEVRDRHMSEEQQRAALRAANEHLDAGRLETGRALIEQIDDRRLRGQLREQLDVREDRARALLTQAETALRDGNAAAALRFWTDAVTRHGRVSDARNLALRLAPAVRAELDNYLSEGRLERFCATAQAGAVLRDDDPGFVDYLHIAATLDQLAAHLAERDFSAVREALLRLSAAGPAGAWLTNCLEITAALCAAQERLLSSPLATLSPQIARLPERGPEGRGPQPATIAHRDAPPQAAGTSAAAPADAPQNLLLLVDAAGSCLLTMRPSIRIGRAGGNAAVDVPVPADLVSHHADIVRADDDYFLVAHGPATVNHRPVRRVLLRDGDRIVLGTQGRMTFHKPSSRSASAVLRLADRCRLPQDVSQVVLFADTCLVGPQPSCHVQTRDNQTRIVLFERSGKLHGRRVGADGRNLDQADPLAFGCAQVIGDQRLTVTTYAPQFRSA